MLALTMMMMSFSSLKSVTQAVGITILVVLIVLVWPWLFVLAGGLAVILFGWFIYLVIQEYNEEQKNE